MKIDKCSIQDYLKIFDDLECIGETEEENIDGNPVIPNYSGNGYHRVVMIKKI